MKIVAVALLDSDVLGHDIFFVEDAPGEVTQYEVERSGKITAVSPVQSHDEVMSSVEKFNHGYLLATPVEIASKDKLPGYLGKFEAVTATEAKLK